MPFSDRVRPRYPQRIPGIVKNARWRFPLVSGSFGSVLCPVFGKSAMVRKDRDFGGARDSLELSRRVVGGLTSKRIISDSSALVIRSGNMFWTHLLVRVQTIFHTKRSDFTMILAHLQTKGSKMEANRPRNSSYWYASLDSMDHWLVKHL